MEGKTGEKVDIFRLYSQRRLVCADRTTRYLERGTTKGILAA